MIEVPTSPLFDPMLSDELNKLKVLYEEGQLTDEEYSQAKAQLLKNSGRITPQEFKPLEPGARQPLFGLTASTYCVIMQLSQYAGYLLPLAGFVVPIGMWLVGREDSDMVDQHGREIANWIIASIIYWVIAIVVCFTLIGIVIGIPLMVVVGVLSLIMPIIGAVNATDNKPCNYPLNIRFF
jgi:uncharacterized protein